MEINSQAVLRSRKRGCKRQNSLETPRALLSKVIEEKKHRNSSTFVFNTQLSNIVSTKSPKFKERASMKPVDENVYSSDTDENITADYLLVGSKETNMSAKRNAPTKTFPAKRKFKFSRVSNQALQSLHNVNETSPSKIVDKPKLSKNNTLKETSSKIKPLEHYFNSSHQNKSLQKSVTNIENIQENSITDKQRDKGKSVDRSACEPNLTFVNDQNQSISITKTQSAAEARKKMSVTITPLSRSNASGSKERAKSGKISSNSLISNHRDDENIEKDNTLGVNETSKCSLRLCRKNNSSDCERDAEQQKSNSPPPLHESAFLSPVLDLTNDIECEENRSIKSVKTKKSRRRESKKSAKNELDAFSQMLGDDTSKSTSHAAQKLHSTAVNIDTQALGFDASLIEPMASSSATPDEITQPQLIMPNVDREPEVNEQNQLLMELGASSSFENIDLANVPRIPDSVVRHIMQHFSEMPIAPSSMSVVNACCDDFWKQTLDTLQAYSYHGHRQMLNVADVELLLYRQGFARDRHSLNALIEQYLPIDLSSEIISSAAAGDHV